MTCLSLKQTISLINHGVTRSVSRSWLRNTIIQVLTFKAVTEKFGFLPSLFSCACMPMSINRYSTRNGLAMVQPEGVLENRHKPAIFSTTMHSISTTLSGTTTSHPLSSNLHTDRLIMAYRELQRLKNFTIIKR